MTSVVALALYGWLGIGILVLAFAGIPLLGHLIRWLERRDDNRG